MLGLTPKLEKMERLNLFQIDDQDLEFFFDTIVENALSDDELLAINSIKEFGNDCSLEVLTHEIIKTENIELNLPGGSSEKATREIINSRYYLHMQAEMNIKIDLVWEKTTDANDVIELQVIEQYFQSDNGTLIDDQPLYDPRYSPYWEEFLDDFEG